VSLEGRLDDVSISDVQGRVALDGDFFGDTNLAHIGSPVHFHSSRTDVEVVSIPGDLSIDSGDLQLNNATGPARISTSAKDVECTGITGDCGWRMETEISRWARSRRWGKCRFTTATGPST
jgi:hypothetical protein